MQSLMSGTRWVEARAPIRPTRWIAVGLLLASVTGLGSVLFGFPFLTSHTVHANLPWIGDVQLPSATFFDLGVLILVVGAPLLKRTALAHQSIPPNQPIAYVATPTPAETVRHTGCSRRACGQSPRDSTQAVSV